MGLQDLDTFLAEPMTPEAVAAGGKPRLVNPDNTVSTERTITIESGGKHYNIPTIIGGRAFTPDQAIAEWRSGRNAAVGVFNTSQEAEAAARNRSDAIGKAIAAESGLSRLDDFLAATPPATTWRQRMFKTGQETLQDPNATAIERFLAGYTVGAREAATEGAAGDPRLPFAVRALPHAIQTLFLGPPSGILTGLQTSGAISPETAKELSNLAVSMTPAFMAPRSVPSRVGRVTEPLRAREAMLEKPAEARPIPEPTQPVAPAVIPESRTPVTSLGERGTAQGPEVAPAAPSAPVAQISGIQAEIARLTAENEAMRQAIGQAGPVIPEPVKRVAKPTAKSTPTGPTTDVGLDSKLTGRQVTLGYDDASILQEMEGRVRNVGGETATKAFRGVGAEFRDRQGPEVVGFKTPKPEWMQDAKKPGEYYGYQETLNAIEALRSGKWPKTAKQQRIAEQLMDAVKFDAEQEKAAIRGAEKAVEAHDVSIAADVAREQQIQDAFFSEVDRLAAEETGVPAVVSQAAQPAEAARPVKDQPEMFTGREMIGPAVRQEKVGTAVPQAAIGDELLAGMRKPEPETQVPIPETVQPKQVTLGSLGGVLQDAAGFLPESIRNIPAAYRRQVQKGIDYIVAKTPKVFREGRGLGNEYVDLVHDRSADLANYVERAVELGGKLQEGLTPAEKARVDQVLRGGITVNPAIQAVVAPARALINELQSKLVKYGYLTPEDVQLFQERFRENPAYLRRLYASKLVPPDEPILTGSSTGPVGRGVKSEALMMRGDIKDVQLPLMGGEPLVGRQRAEFLQPYLKKGYRLIKVEGETATLFRDIAPGKRQELGEMRGQPGFVAARTIAEQARIVANHEFLEAISKNPAWAKVALTEEELASGTWTRLKGDKKKWGPLADYFVQKAVAKEVSNSIRLRQDWEKVVGRLVGMWKYGKVIMNPAAMGRNTISSAILADFGGLHPWMVDSYAAGARDLVKGTGYVPEAKKLGLFRTGFAHNEITQLAEGIVRSEQSNAMLRVLDAVHDIAVATGEKTRVKPSKLYGAIENFYRYNLYRYGREQLSLSPKDARRYSLKYAIDYEVVSPFVAALRGTGGGTFGPLAAVAGAPFATFASKAIPLTLETLALHPVRVLKYPAAIYGLTKLAESQIGQAPEETRAQRLLGELSSIRYALLPFRDKDGRAQYLDLGYILPFGDLLEFGDMLMGETGRRANISLLPIVGHPAFTVAELALNRAGFTGKDIVAPSDDSITAVRKRAEHLLQSWGPALTPRLPPLEKGGFAFEDIRKSFTGETDFLGRTRSPGAAALANILGLRAKGVTTAELANYKATQFEKMFDDIDAQALQIATTYRNQPDEANRRIGELMQRARTIAVEAKALFGAIPKEFSRPRPPEPVRKAIGGGA